MSAGPEWLTLEPDEELRWRGEPRTSVVLGTVASALLYVVVAAVAVWVVLARPLSQIPDVPLPVPEWYLWGAFGLVVLWALGSVGWAYLRVSNVEYVLTTENVYKRRGVLSETVTRVSVDRIQSTRLRKDWTGNVFDYGDVGLSTAGGSGIEMWVTDVHDPDEFRRELRRLISEADTGGVGSHRRAGSPTGSPGLDEAVAEARRMRETAQRIEEVLRG